MNGLPHEECGAHTRLNVSVVAWRCYTEGLDTATLILGDHWSREEPKRAQLFFRSASLNCAQDNMSFKNPVLYLLIYSGECPKDSIHN